MCRWLMFAILAIDGDNDLIDCDIRFMYNNIEQVLQYNDDDNRGIVI
jgi:hypothetical protein